MTTWRNAHKKKLRLTLSRHDVVALIWAIEALEDDYRYDGGLVMCEDETRIKEYLEDRLRAHDTRHGLIAGAAL